MVARFLILDRGRMLCVRSLQRCFYWAAPLYSCDSTCKNIPVGFCQPTKQHTMAEGESSCYVAWTRLLTEMPLNFINSHWNVCLESESDFRKVLVQKLAEVEQPERPEELTDEYRADAKGADDVFSACYKYVPRGMWIDAAGDPEGLCYAPWLCLCFWLFIPFPRLKELLGIGFGRYCPSTGIHRASKGLQRSRTFG